MMFPYINDFESGKLIDSLSIDRYEYAEVRLVNIKNKEQEVVSVNWATEILSQNNDRRPFTPFLSTLVPTEKAFSDNQPIILSYANQLFEGSRPLSELEEMVLTQTIN